jgi:hypothetical protein
MKDFLTVSLRLFQSLQTWYNSFCFPHFFYSWQNQTAFELTILFMYFQDTSKIQIRKSHAIWSSGMRRLDVLNNRKIPPIKIKINIY